MKRNLLIILIVCLICLFTVGCRHEHDHVDIWNKSVLTFDNVEIEAKDGYFYDRHEKHIVDENTISITIYFTNDKDRGWSEMEVGD